MFHYNIHSPSGYDGNWDHDCIANCCDNILQYHMTASLSDGNSRTTWVVRATCYIPARFPMNYLCGKPAGKITNSDQMMCFAVTL